MTIEYEIDAEEVRTWASRRPMSISVHLWEVQHELHVAGNDSTSTTTRRLLQSWRLPVDPEAGAS